MKTTISGIIVEIEQYDDSSNCYLSYKKYDSSLALAEDLGGFEDSDTGEIHPIDPATLYKISAWAYANGY
jgi:hypothetical protein